jgi:phage host-nuclease inhibitor protein Gam
MEAAMPDDPATNVVSHTRTTRPPRNLRDAAQLINDLGSLLLGRKDRLQGIDTKRARLRARLKALDDEEARIKRGYARRLDLRANAVFTYGQENYDELTDGGESRTVLLPTGARFRWRNSGLKVLHINTKDFFKEARRKRLFQLFVRVKIVLEPNLEALTTYPEQARRLKSVTLGTEDTFTILPNGTDERYKTVVEDPDRTWSVEVPRKK